MAKASDTPLRCGGRYVQSTARCSVGIISTPDDPPCALPKIGRSGCPNSSAAALSEAGKSKCLGGSARPASKGAVSCGSITMRSLGSTPRARPRRIIQSTVSLRSPFSSLLICGALVPARSARACMESPARSRNARIRLGSALIMAGSNLVVVTVMDINFIDHVTDWIILPVTTLVHFCEELMVERIKTLVVRRVPARRKKCVIADGAAWRALRARVVVCHHSWRAHAASAPPRHRADRWRGALDQQPAGAHLAEPGAASIAQPTAAPPARARSRSRLPVLVIVAASADR